MKISEGYKPFLVQLEIDVYNQIKELSHVSGYSMSDIVRNALKKALNEK